MTLLLIERGSDIPIRTKDVDGDGRFIGAFEHRENEIAAKHIVRFCQSRKSWRPFQFKQLQEFCEADVLEAIKDFIQESVWISFEDGLVKLSTAFVARCYESAPVQGTPKKKRFRKPKFVNRISRYERLLNPCI